jgi:lipoate-protein ligase B
MSFRNSLNIQEQALRLVEQSGFPVVMGFEFYPCVIRGGAPLTAADSVLLRDFEAQGFEISADEALGECNRLQVPGQLVIRPLVPYQKLQISVKSFAQVLKDSTIQWLQKYKIQAQEGAFGDSENIGIATSAGVIAKVQVSEDRGMAHGWISIHLSSELAWKETATDSLDQQGVHLEMRPAFDEWVLYFTNALLAAVPGSGTVQ